MKYKRLLLPILLLILICVFLWVGLVSYRKIASPWWEKELLGYAYLGRVPQDTPDCKTCPATLFYWDDDHIDDCTIKKAFFPQWLGKDTQEDTMVDISTQTLEQRQQERDWNPYMFNISVYEKFEQICWPETWGNLLIPPMSWSINVSGNVVGTGIIDGIEWTAATGTTVGTGEIVDTVGTGKSQ